VLSDNLPSFESTGSVKNGVVTDDLGGQERLPCGLFRVMGVVQGDGLLMADVQCHGVCIGDGSHISPHLANAYAHVQSLVPDWIAPVRRKVTLSPSMASTRYSIPVDAQEPRGTTVNVMTLPTRGTFELLTTRIG
jgi:hypothetical protein